MATKQERMEAKYEELRTLYPEETKAMRDTELHAMVEHHMRLEQLNRLRPYSRGAAQAPYSLEAMAKYNAQRVKMAEAQQQLLSDIAKGGEEGLKAKVKIWTQGLDALKVWTTQYSGLEKTKVTQSVAALKNMHDGAEGSLELMRKIEDVTTNIDLSGLQNDYADKLDAKFSSLVKKAEDETLGKPAMVRIDVATGLSADEQRKFQKYVETHGKSLNNFFEGKPKDAFKEAERNKTRGVIGEFSLPEQAVLGGVDPSTLLAGKPLKEMFNEYARLKAPDQDEAGRAAYALGLRAIISPENHTELYFGGTGENEGMMEAIRNTHIPNMGTNITKLAQALGGNDPDQVSGAFEALTKGATVPEELMPAWEKQHEQFMLYGNSLLTLDDQPTHVTPLVMSLQELETDPQFQELRSAMPPEKQTAKETIKEYMRLSEMDARGRRKAENLQRKIAGEPRPTKRARRLDRLKAFSEITQKYPSAALNQTPDPESQGDSEDETPPPLIDGSTPEN